MPRGKERGAPRRICCVAAVLLSAALACAERPTSLAEWRKRDQGEEADGDCGGGTGPQAGAEGGRSAELAQWRQRNRERRRACGVGEHIEGRWVAMPAGEEEAHAPCCDLLREDERDMMFCGGGHMPNEVVFPPGQDVTPLRLYEWDYQFFSGRKDFLVHVGGNGCSCKRVHPGWVDRYVWEP
ncbi:hypothetical protein T484DRAFT_1764901, partial [Baffinella frigidus]